uniref:DDE-1 domain-containing protein n=1 Tax=Chrysemys picta bellii TaxID=8478 RepID=A0A8C3FJ63_CHRPI
AESTLRERLKNESKLNGSVPNIDSAAGLKRKRVRNSAKPTTDKATRTWFAQERPKGMPLSGPILQAQGFTSRFKTRHGIAQVSISGESRGCERVSHYHEEQLCNCDATALFANLLPDKTLAFNYETQKTAGFQKIKDRVTLTHTLAPLLIGGFHNPHCFNHLNRVKLPVIYANCKNAWMTRHIFDDWFHNSFVPAVHKHLRLKKLKVKALLLLDNCPAHPPAESLVKSDGKIRVLYLPFNTTSKIQPGDQGIIQNFKNNYRREPISVIVSCTSSGISEFLKQLNMKEIIYLVKKAWDRVKQKSIENCWMKAPGDAFSVKGGSDSENSTSGTDSEPDYEGFWDEDVLQTHMQTKEDKGKLLFPMIKHFSLDTSPEIITEWLEMDEDCLTSEFLSKEEILTGCEATSDRESDGENSNNAGLNDNDDEEEDVVEKVKISPPEALRAVETVVSFMEEQNAENIEIIHLRRMTDFIRKEKNANPK